MSIKEIVALSLELSLFLLVFSIGLESRWSDVVHVLRRPALLVRAILAVNVIVPAVVVTLCLILPIAPWTEAGLVIMAVSPLAPFAPVKMLKSEAEQSYVIGTYVALMLCAVVLVPLTAEILKPLTAQSIGIPVAVVAAYVVETVLVPLFAGVLVHSQWEAFSARIAPLTRKVALTIVVLVAVIMLLRFAKDLISLPGDGTLVVVMSAVAAGLFGGYALGGPDLGTRKALGDAAATRHPGLAAAIAQLGTNDSRVLSAIVLYLFSSIIFSAAFNWALRAARMRPFQRSGVRQ
ncbi:MAG TPA: hypothetical protein VE820_00310 [Sphingomicrobium sp.]|nr:hypothetical protein [Sphingomicrobium sp.]